MFTGIVHEIARVARITKAARVTNLAITTTHIHKDTSVSDSININGTCLTVTAKEKNFLFFDAVRPTLTKTNLSRLKKGEAVNCERALKIGDRLGGHFVLGHVDAQLRLRRIVKKGSYWQFEIVLPSQYRRSVVTNGSIAIDGISLTVKNISSQVLSVDVIPFTFKNTTLQYKKPGDWLNIEFDYLLKKKE